MVLVALLLARDSTDELMAKATRLPIGTAAIGASPSLGTMDLPSLWGVLLSVEIRAEQHGQIGRRHRRGIVFPVHPGTGNSKPYADEISLHLGHQYLLTFAASGGPKGQFVSVKLKTELADVDLMTHASAVWVAQSRGQ